jgi:hypothetical protein
VNGENLQEQLAVAIAERNQLRAALEFTRGERDGEIRLHEITRREALAVAAERNQLRAVVAALWWTDMPTTDVAGNPVLTDEQTRLAAECVNWAHAQLDAGGETP